MSTELINTFPRWKNALVFVILFLSVIYAIPNLFGEDPALQIAWDKTLDSEKLPALETEVKQLSQGATSIEPQANGFLIRFKRPQDQLYAKDELAAKFSNDASIALNLAPRTPKFLSYLHADPMKLGLDLRGGVHFLLEIDMESAIQRRLEGLTDSLRQSLREKRLRYNRLSYDPTEGMQLEIEEKYLEGALDILKSQYPDLSLNVEKQNGVVRFVGGLSLASVQDIKNYTADQTLSTLRNRVNELGVAEALVQRQGGNRVIVELPGVQDTARAKEILGKTATLEFLLEDTSVDPQKALQGHMPPGSS